MAIHSYKLKVKEITKETDDSVSIEFDIPQDLKDLFQYKQGQSIAIQSNIDGERRSYSISSSPLENKLVIAVKLVPDGVFSTFALKELKVGDELDVMQPTGRFYSELNQNQKKNYLFFAAGSGITPIISIIKATLAIEPKSTVSLVYGNRTFSSIIYKEKLLALKNKYMDRLSITHVFSREPVDMLINAGRIHEAKLEALAKVYDYNHIDEVFVCGPEQMILTVKDFFEKRGLPSKNIHFELFITDKQMEKGKEKEPEESTKTSSSSGEVSEVTIIVDDETYEIKVPYDQPVILDAGLNEDIDLPYSCRSGVCTTCRAKLLEGKVDMDVCYGLDEDEIAEGYILTCQSHPRTPVVKVDYDQ